MKLVVPTALVGAVLRSNGLKSKRLDGEATEADLRSPGRRTGPFRPPSSLAARVRITVDEVDGWLVYRFAPSQGPSQVRILFFHGGGYVIEISRHHWNFAAELATRTGAEVVVPIYPLAPRQTAAAVVAGSSRLLSALLASHGAEAVTVIGDSAGGGLAVAAAMQVRDEHGRQPARLILFAPWLDVTMSDPRQAAIEPLDPMLARPGLAAAGRVYAGGLAVTDWRVSPIFGDFAGLAPMSVFTGTRDILLTDTYRLGELAQSAGSAVDVEIAQNQFHVYPLMPTIAGAKARERVFRLVGPGETRHKSRLTDIITK